MNRRVAVKTWLAFGIAAAGGNVFAHTGDAHGKKAGPVKKEQKPWGMCARARPSGS